MNELDGKQVMIECPHTVFVICVHNEDEYMKVALFMRNIRFLKHVGITDIYNWCNRQQMLYQVRFRYRKGSSVWANVKWYVAYSKQKRTQYRLNTATT